MGTLRVVVDQPFIQRGPQAVTRVVKNVGQTVSYDYDPRGNLDGRYEGTTLTHDYTFNVENRLASVRTSNQTTTFAYDADGQRVMTTRPDGTVVYTPFPDYEVEDRQTGADIIRTTYRIAGQIVAMQTKEGTNGAFRYTYTDHLGNIVALSQGNSYVGGSLARYDPFGNYRTTPDESVNPDITNHGFTGHRMNNTGEFPIENVGLIYMNARYYLPEVGRFISPDTIVPEPGNPQSYNRYSYVNNDPVNNSDPTGHWLESALDIAFIAYDLYDIQQNGLNLTNGLSLVADVGGLVLPVVTGGGLAVRALTHADDAADLARGAANVVESVATHGDEIKRLSNIVEEGAEHGDDLPSIVIGENMERVSQYANQINGQTINDFIPTTEWTREKNITWAQKMREQGRKIVDIGPDFSRRRDFKEAGHSSWWSPDYNNERKMFDGYKNYQKEFKRWGKFEGGSWIDIQ